MTDQIKGAESSISQILIILKMSKRQYQQDDEEVKTPWSVLRDLTKSPARNYYIYASIVSVGYSSSNDIIIKNLDGQPQLKKSKGGDGFVISKEDEFVHITAVSQTKVGRYVLKTNQKQVLLSYSQIWINWDNEYKQGYQFMILTNPQQNRDLQLWKQYCRKNIDSLPNDQRYLQYPLCPICLGPYVQPVVYDKCKHSFCGGCLSIHFHQNQIVSCPVCNDNNFQSVSYNSILDDEVHEFLKQHPEVKRQDKDEINRLTMINNIGLFYTKSDLIKKYRVPTPATTRVFQVNLKEDLPTLLKRQNQTRNQAQKGSQQSAQRQEGFAQDFEFFQNKFNKQRSLFSKLLSKAGNNDDIQVISDSENSDSESYTSLDDSDSDTNSLVKQEESQLASDCTICTGQQQQPYPDNLKTQCFFCKRTSCILVTIPKHPTLKLVYIKDMALPKQFQVQHFRNNKEEFKLFMKFSTHTSPKSFFFFLFKNYIQPKKYIYQVDSTLYNDAPSPKDAKEVFITDELVICNLESGKLFEDFVIQYCIFNRHALTYMDRKEDCLDGICCVKMKNANHAKEFNHMVRRRML